MRYRGRDVVNWSYAVILMGLIPPAAWAQAPEDPSGAPPASPRPGLLHRLFHHTGRTLEDKFVGYPNTFIEPPLGYYVNEQLAVQVAKADPHRFTVYRSDFLPGTNQFSPIGASRFNLMFARLPGWAGPIVVEWTPDQPSLAQSRRQAVLATLAQAGQPILAQRVVVGPSPYPGAMGVEAVNVMGNTLVRSQAAGATFMLPPNVSSNQGVR